MVQIEWSEEAEADLDDILSYLSYVDKSRRRGYSKNYVENHQFNPSESIFLSSRRIGY